MKILNKKEQMDMNKDNDYCKLFDLIILTEGHKNHYKEDRGGKTNFGLSQAFLDLVKIDKDPYELTLEEAKEVYYKHFYLQFKINEFSDYNLKEFLFELCVNVRPKTYGTICQKAYNILVEGSPLTVDGIAGKNTRQKLNGYKDVKRLIKSLVIQSCVHYTKEAEEDERQERFIIGWYNRVLKHLK